MPPMCRGCPDVNKLRGMDTTILGQHQPFMSIKSFVQHSGWQEMVSLCSLIRLIGVCTDRDQPEFLCSRSDSRYLEVHCDMMTLWCDCLYFRSAVSGRLEYWCLLNTCACCKLVVGLSAYGTSLRHHIILHGGSGISERTPCLSRLKESGSADSESAHPRTWGSQPARQQQTGAMTVTVWAGEDHYIYWLHHIDSAHHIQMCHIWTQYIWHACLYMHVEIVLWNHARRDRAFTPRT